MSHPSPHKPLKIRPVEERDHRACLAIVDSLPEWFDADARQRAVPADLNHQRGFVAEMDGEAVGFITLFVAEGRLNIGWLAVHKDHHRQGIGGQLIARAAKRASELGLTELATYTLGDGVDYPPYEQTRAFYFRHGFEVYQRSTTDNPGCPQEIRIKKRIRHPNTGAEQSVSG